MVSQLQHKVFTTNNENFEETVCEVFSFQAKYCKVYRDYLFYLGINPLVVSTANDIPFLPIRFYKNFDVLAEGRTAQTVFTSSATSGMGQSRHLVADISLYEQSFLNGFRHFYNPPNHYCILALLPGYVERGGSSLVYMADRLVHESEHPRSGFYLNDLEGLANVLRQNENEGVQTLLLGVSFALLDFAAQFQFSLTNTIVMETGGMKGKRKELTRAELHNELTIAFGLGNIHSEYGMTELFSQAYSKQNGLFACPPWMRVLIRDTDDPFKQSPVGKTGGINVIDLANIYSCSFIETEDLGRLHPDGRFEVLGRMDFSEVRGCNTMVG